MSTISNSRAHVTEISITHVQSWTRRGTQGEDDEAEGNENEVVDLADEAPNLVPCKQIRKENDNIGKEKVVVVLDLQSRGEDNDTKCRGIRMEEYENHLSQ